MSPLVLGTIGVLVMLSGALAVHAYTAWQQRLQDSRSELRLLNQLVAQASESIFEQISGNVRVIGDRLLELEQRRDRDGFAALMKDFVAATPGFARVVVVAANGEQLYLSVPAGQPSTGGPFKTPSVAPTYDQAARQTGLFLGRTFLNPFGQWVIPMRYPVRDGAGRLRLFVAGGMSIEERSYFLARFQLPEGYVLRLLRTDGYAQLAHPLPAEQRQQFFTQPLPEPVRKRIESLRPGEAGIFTDEGGSGGAGRLGAYQRLPDFDLVTEVSLPLSRVRAAWLREMQLSAGLFFVFVLGGGLVIAMALRSQRRLTRARLRSEQELRQNEALLQLALESAQMDLWSRVSGTQDLQTAEKVAERAALPRDILPTSLKQYLAMVHPDDRERMAQGLHAAEASDAPVDEELRIVLPDASVRWIEVHGRTLHEAGGVRRRVGTVREITGRKNAEEEIHRLNLELEQRVVSRTAELARANHALESFSYSVAHDLRAPVRAIGSYASMLKGDFAERLGPEALGLVARILAMTQTTTHMIDGLLRLAQLARIEPRRVRVDLSRLAQSVAEHLRGEHAAREVAVKIAPDLAVEGDPVLLETVIQNLFANAWKYTVRRERAEIEFAAHSEADGRRVFHVRDNGAGFDMRYAAKLFGVFQRMHTQSEFPGTGVGLSIVQRIVERHNGRIWAEAEAGRGAVFYFTLWEPAANDVTASSAARSA